MLVYSTALGLLVGIAAVLLGAGLSAATAALLLCGGLCILGVTKRHAYFFVAAVFCAALALGVARTDIFVAGEAYNNLAPYVGKGAVVEGRVVNDPERRENSLHAYVRVSSINDEPVHGTALVTLPREADVQYGDTVRAKGKLEVPASFETNTGRLFDYPSYLRVRGISVVMNFASLESSKPGGWSLRGTLFAVKHVFEGSLRKLLPEPGESLMEGILLGERRGIPVDLNQALIIVGLIHIVVLSGYNVSIVAEQALRFFNLFLPRTISYAVGAVALVLFAIMVGAGATVVRASVMGLIAILARVLERPALALRSLGVAAVAMALWNPTVVLYDPSFILSVLATFGLITLSPTVEQKLKFVSEKFGLRSIVASTISVQIYILPSLLYFTGILSAFALVANALVLPLVPSVMFFGFIAGLLGMIHTALALPFAVVAHLLLAWMTTVATGVAALPFSSTTVSTFPAWVAVLVYIPLTALVIWRYSRTFAQPHSSSSF